MESSVLAEVTNNDERITSSSHIYDTATLVKLGMNSRLSRRELRFSEEAPLEHVLKEPVSKHSFRAIMDPERYEDSSGPYTLVSDDEDAACQGGVSLVQPKLFLVPERQPLFPPQSEVAQQHAGFARFMKEHASPTSQRVTAGGRIVPAGPKSPPPTFHMDFIDHILREAEAAHKTTEAVTERTDRWNEPFGTGIRTTKADAKTVKVSDQRHGEGESLKYNDEAKAEPSYNTTAPPLGNPTVAAEPAQFGNAANTQRTSSGPVEIPAFAQPVAMLADGTAIVNIGGAFLRAVTRNGTVAFENLQLVPAPAAYPQPPAHPVVPRFQQAAATEQTESYQMPYQQISDQQMLSLPHRVPVKQIGLNHNTAGSQQMMAFGPFGGSYYPNLHGNGMNPHLPMPAQTAFASNPVPITQQPEAPCYTSADVGEQLRSLSSEQRSLQAELTAVDRQYALHEHDMNPLELASITARRKFLVEKIDNIRRSIKNFEEAKKKLDEASIDVASAGASGYVPSPGFGQRQRSGTYESFPGAGNLIGVPLLDTSAFGAVRTSGHEQSSNVHKSAKVLNSKVSSSKIKRSNTHLSPTAPAFIPGDQQMLSSYVNSHSNAQAIEPSKGNEAQYPSEPSTPTWAKAPTEWGEVKDFRGGPILQEDMDYCEKIGFNNPHVPKKYCTTVLEMQEAISQARERVKRYGSLLGDDEDAQWSAELDLRQAMREEVPIPIPPRPAEFVTNQTPYDWQDSVFNVRRGQDSDWLPETYARFPGEVQMEADRGHWTVSGLERQKAYMDVLADDKTKAEAAMAADTAKAARTASLTRSGNKWSSNSNSFGDPKTPTRSSSSINARGGIQSSVRSGHAWTASRYQSFAEEANEDSGVAQGGRGSAAAVGIRPFDSSKARSNRPKKGQASFKYTPDSKVDSPGNLKADEFKSVPIASTSDLDNSKNILRHTLETVQNAMNWNQMPNETSKEFGVRYYGQHAILEKIKNDARAKAEAEADRSLDAKQENQRIQNVKARSSLASPTYNARGTVRNVSNPTAPTYLLAGQATGSKGGQSAFHPTAGNLGSAASPFPRTPMFDGTNVGARGWYSTVRSQPPNRPNYGHPHLQSFQTWSPHQGPRNPAGW